MVAESLSYYHHSHNSDQWREWREQCVGDNKTPSALEPGCTVMWAINALGKKHSLYIRHVYMQPVWFTLVLVFI